MKRLIILLTLIFVFLNVYSEQKKPIIFVSILPQKYFVKRIAGNNFIVKVMVKPNENPAVYEPTIKQLSLLKKTKLYFSIGVPFEKVWLKKIKEMYPDLFITDTSKGIKKRYMDTFDRSKNISKNPDPHIWLSPLLVKKQAENIYMALVRLYPDKKDLFYKNYTDFTRDLDNLHNQIKANLSNIENRKIAVFHPSWGYFADEFSFKQIPIEIEGKQPTPKKLKKIIDYLKANKIKVIFVQKQFSTKLAESVAKQIGAKVMAIDPLSEDYIKNLLEISELLKENLK